MLSKSSILTATSLSILGSIVLANSSQAALINFGNWNKFGDVATPSLGQSNLSTNALQDDDFPNPDSNFNFSSNAAIDTQTLESNLGLPSQSLDPDPVNFVIAFEGSGLQQAYTFLQPTTLQFNWTFLTNDATRNTSGLDLDDYAFIAIDNQIVTLASTNSSVTSLIASSTNFSREASGSYSLTFNPGTYNIALGVVDIDNNTNTSALQISNAQLSNNQQVPESSSLLALLVPFGVILLGFRKQQQ